MPTFVPQCISVRLHLSKMFRPLIFSGEQTFFGSHKCKQTLELGVWRKRQNSTLTLMWKKRLQSQCGFVRFSVVFSSHQNSCYLTINILYDLFVEGVVQTIFVSVATVVFAMLE